MASRFVSSAQRHNQLPLLGMPEVAFIGRSNVGKSSLVGCLLKQPKLVRTSRTPGRTRLLNLFVLDEKLAIVDLPGYGYAKVSKTAHAELDKMVQGYLTSREHLHGVVQVVDARRAPVSAYDQFVASWIVEQDRPLLIAVTKIDLVPKNRRLNQLRAIEKQLGLPAGSALPCSSKTGEGRKELVARLLELRP